MDPAQPETANRWAEVPSWSDFTADTPMGLMHCPLCIGLAVLSAVRFSAHAWLVWRRYGPPQPQAPKATLAAA